MISFTVFRCRHWNGSLLINSTYAECQQSSTFCGSSTRRWTKYSATSQRAFARSGAVKFNTILPTFQTLWKTSYDAKEAASAARCVRLAIIPQSR